MALKKKKTRAEIELLEADARRRALARYEEDKARGWNPIDPRGPICPVCKIQFDVETGEQSKSGCQIINRQFCNARGDCGFAQDLFEDSEVQPWH
jgi:hypothetical protein